MIFFALTTAVANATKYAGEPYYIAVGGRALGMGGTGVAAPPDGASPFWNAAAITASKSAEVVLQHAETFGTLLDHDFVGGVLPGERLGSGWALGAYITRLGGGGILLTEFDSTTNRPLVAEEASHNNWTIALAAAHSFGRYGSAAVTVKSLLNSLPSNSAFGLGLDLSWWKTWGRLRTGVKLADATSTFLSYDSSRTETIVPHVNWGAEIDIPPVVLDGLNVTLAGEAETYFENRRTSAQYWRGSVSVDLHLGVEVNYRHRLFARAGSDAGRLALGAGFLAGPVGVDAAMVDHQFLDSSYRVSLRLLLK